MNKNLLLSVAALGLLSQASAAVFVTSAGTTANGTQAGVGHNPDTLFIAFSLNAPGQVVSSLGVFAGDVDSGTHTFATTMHVSLWSEHGGLLSSANITSGTVQGGFVYGGISPVALTTDNYALVVTGFSATDKFGDQQFTPDTHPVYNGFASFAQEASYSGVGNPFASVAYNIGANRVTLASFTSTAVPEPEVFATVAGVMLVGFGLYRRQVSK